MRRLMCWLRGHVKGAGWFEGALRYDGVYQESFRCQRCARAVTETGILH
jgi:hypothetical protein